MKTLLSQRIKFNGMDFLLMHVEWNCTSTKDLQPSSSLKKKKLFLQKKIKLNYILFFKISKFFLFVFIFL